MNLNQPATAQARPSVEPTSILRTESGRRFELDFNRSLLSERVTIDNSVKTHINASRRNFFEEIHTKLYYQAERDLLSERIETNSPEIPADQLQTEIYTRLRVKFEQKATILAQVIASKLHGTESQVRDRRGRDTVVINSSNIVSVTTLINSLATTLHDTEFSELIQNISQSADSLEDSVLAEVFNRVSTITRGAQIDALRSMSSEISTAGGVPSRSVESSPAVFSLTVLQSLSYNQQLQLAEHAVHQISTQSDKAEAVLRELVTTGSVPLSIVERYLSQVGADSTNPQIFRDVYQRISRYQSNSRQALGTAQSELATAVSVAALGDGDISNAALKGSSWAKLLGFYYGVVLASVNLSTGLMSGDVSGAIAGAAPGAALSAVLWGDRPTEVFGRLADRLAYSREGRDQMTQNERKDLLARLTLYGSSDAVNLFSSDDFIRSLRNTVNPESSETLIDLSRFERRLQQVNPTVYQSYFNSYAKNFSSNRSQLRANLTSIALAYHDLQISSHQDYLDQIASPRGFTSDMLTNLG